MELKRFRARTSSRLLPHRDPNGFRRLIVLLSENGARLLCFAPSRAMHRSRAVGYLRGCLPETNANGRGNALNARMLLRYWCRANSQHAFVCMLLLF